MTECYLIVPQSTRTQEKFDVGIKKHEYYPPILKLENI